LREETQIKYPNDTNKNEEILTLDGINQTMRFHLIKAQVDKAIQSIHMFSTNDQKEIGERELRKILN